MLKAPDGTPITSTPHPEQYKDLIAHLEAEEQKELTDIIIGLIQKGKYHNSYVLGSRYINTSSRLHELIYKAAGGDKKKAGIYFGLYLYITLMQLEEEWFVKTASSEGRFTEKGHDYYKSPTDLKKKYINTN